MNRIRLTSSNHQAIISKAVEMLNAGGILIYPTETCYGVGVDATNQKAVEKLLRYKERPAGKPVSIAVADETMARQYVEVNETARNLYKNFLPGPVTVISNSLNKVAAGIEAEDGSLGIRIPDYPFMLKLIRQFGKPITATSANLSGRKTPYAIQDILDNASEKNKKLIGLMIDAGELPHNPPSTVVDTRLHDVSVLRQGELLFANKPGKTYLTKSPEETQEIGRKLMEELLSELPNKCVVFALQGDLGAGKTQFAKGVARALGIAENITSPTFTIVQEYRFNRQTGHMNGMMYHIDTWRLHEGSELSDLGFKDMMKPGNVVVVEWVEKAKDLIEKFQKDSVIKRIVIGGKDEKRTIVIHKEQMRH